jgi:hypothetical protein
MSIAVRGDDRVDLDDAALAGLRAVAAANAIQQRAAGIGHLTAVVQRGRDAVVDPLEWHSRDIGSQNFLAQRVQWSLHLDTTVSAGTQQVSPTDGQDSMAYMTPFVSSSAADEASRSA